MWTGLALVRAEIRNVGKSKARGTCCVHAHSNNELETCKMAATFGVRFEGEIPTCGGPREFVGAYYIQDTKPPKLRQVTHPQIPVVGERCTAFGEPVICTGKLVRQLDQTGQSWQVMCRFKSCAAA
jgi:hypothetical protein